MAEIVVHGDAKTRGCVYLGMLWSLIPEAERSRAIHPTTEIMRALGVTDEEIRQTWAVLGVGDARP